MSLYLGLFSALGLLSPEPGPFGEEGFWKGTIALFHAAHPL